MNWQEMLLDAPWQAPSFEDMTEDSLSMPSPSSKSKIYNILQSRNEDEKIVWDTLLIEAINKDPHLHWIENLPSLLLPTEELSAFFHAMETMRCFDEDLTAKKNLFLFTAAKKTLETLYCNGPVLLKASYQFFFISSQLDKTEFSFQSFLENATKTLLVSEEIILSLFVRYVKTAASSQNLDAVSFIKAAIQLLSSLEDTYDWLSLFLDACDEKTLEHTSPIYQLTKALEELVKEKTLKTACFVSRVYQRYQQILKTAGLGSILSGTEQDTPILFLHLPAMRLAHTLVKKQPPSFTLSNACTKTDHFPHIKMHYNVCSGDSFILARIKRNYSSHIRIQLPYVWTERPTLVALQKSVSSASLVRLRCNAELHQRLTGNRGIWPLLSSYLSVKENPDEMEKSYRLHVLTSMSSSLDSLIELSSPLKIPILLSIFEDLACGLDYLHTNGLVHGNVDLKNAVVDDETSSQCIAGWTNFEQTCTANSSFFTQGSYGSKNYSAPEILKKTVKDPYQAEIWAFGQLMYILSIHRKEPPWKPNLDGFYQHVEVLKERQATEHPLNPLIYTMLQVDPTSRPSARQVKETIGQIKVMLNSL